MHQELTLADQKEFLLGKRLIKDRFAPVQPHDHEHCAFCWAYVQQGYRTIGRHPRWICEACFQAFREDFQWTVAEDRTV